MSPPAPTNLRSLVQLDYSVLQQCMHCGLCLPTCPTYLATQIEKHSPRGRIALMRAVADGGLPLNAAIGQEMYFCLGCLACETACPAGVDYTQIFETARAAIETENVCFEPVRWFWRTLLLRGLFRWSWGLRALGKLLWAYQESGLQLFVRRLKLTRLLPEPLRRLEPQTPRCASDHSDNLIALAEHPQQPQMRVGLLTGCLQDIVFASINRDTVDVLKSVGCSVITPREQPCCGSLHGHNGDVDSARDLARRMIDQFEPFHLEAIITNAAGCGSHLKHYDRLLADDPAYAEKAKRWSERVWDVHEFLDDYLQKHGPAPWSDLKTKLTLRTTYHDACHLCHAQKIFREPRSLLRQIPGLTWTELRDASWCCGSAGIYNLTHPDLSAQLLARKIQCLQETQAEVVAAANPGCHLQIDRGLQEAGVPMQVLHPVSLLARALRLSAATKQSELPAAKCSH